MSNDNIDDWMKLIGKVRARLDSGELNQGELDKRLGQHTEPESEPESSALNGLLAEFEDWKKLNAFPSNANTDQLLYSRSSALTPEQRAWLSDFDIRWAREVDAALKRHQGT